MFRKENFYAFLVHALDRISIIEQSNEELVAQRNYDDVPFDILRYIEGPL